MQVKRLHEYKRQHLNVLHVIALYSRLQRDRPAAATPRTVIFGGKAAPGYRMAKLIIKLIHSVAAVVNQDPTSRELLKVVFLPDFNVKNGPAHLSGRGSVGADLDGRQGSVRHREHEVRDERRAHDRHARRRQRRDPRGGGPGELLPVRSDRRSRTGEGGGYDPRHYYESNAELREAIDSSPAGFFAGGDRELFRPLVESLLTRDDYMLLADYQAYVDCQERSATLPRPADWTKCRSSTAQGRAILLGSLDSRLLSRIWNITPSRCREPTHARRDCPQRRAPRRRHGASAPLGATVRPAASTSASSRRGHAIELLLFDGANDAEPARVFPLDPRQHRTYHYWHAFVPGLQPGSGVWLPRHRPVAPEQGLRFDPDKVLLDPYGRAVAVPDGYSRAAAAGRATTPPRR